MVIGVIAVLAGIGLPAYAHLKERSKIRATETLVAGVAAALAGKPLTAQVPNEWASGRPTPAARMVTIALWDVNADGELDGDVVVVSAATSDPGKDGILVSDRLRSSPTVIPYSDPVRGFSASPSPEANLAAALMAAPYSGFMRTTGYVATAKAVNSKGQIIDAWGKPLRYVYAPLVRDTGGTLIVDESFLVLNSASLTDIYAKQQAVKEKVGGSRFGVWSAGPDKIDNTADDIASFP